jgi:hypothetical protein
MGLFLCRSHDVHNSIDFAKTLLIHSDLRGMSRLSQFIATQHLLALPYKKNEALGEQ